MAGLRKPTLPTLIDAEPDWFDLVDYLGGVTSNPQIDATKILLAQGGSLLSTWRHADDLSKIDAAKLLGDIDAAKLVGNIATARIQTNVLAAIIAAEGIVNADVATAAAIAQSKLALAITDTQVAAGAGIAKSKLGALGILDTDVTGPIGKSKISTTGAWGVDEIPTHDLITKHSKSDLTAGQFLRALTANTFGFGAVPFSLVGGEINPAAADNLPVWNALFACTVTNVRGYRVGGSGATINARRKGTDNFLASALSLTSENAWMDGGSVTNTAIAANDLVELMIVSVTGSPTKVMIEVDFTRP